MSFVYNPLPVWQDDNLVLMVKVRAGSKQTTVGGFEHGMLRVHLNVAPDKGKANKALCALLATHFAVAPSQVCVVTGRTNSVKCIRISRPKLIPAEIDRLMKTGIEGMQNDNGQ